MDAASKSFFHAGFQDSGRSRSDKVALEEELRSQRIELVVDIVVKHHRDFSEKHGLRVLDSLFIICVVGASSVSVAIC